MIVLRMSGGLGNQMFQYAFYVKLRSLGREVCFDDTTQYDEEAFRGSEQKRRPKRLDVFGIDYPVVSKEDLTRITDAAMDPASRVRRKLTGRKSLEKRDEDFIFDPSFLEAQEGYYCGNFQSPRYFEGAQDEVRRAFTFPSDLLTREGPAGREDGARHPGTGIAASAAHAPGETNALSRAQAKAAQIERRIRAANARYDARLRTGGPAPFAGGSTSIHLRFGDYLDKQEIYGGICTDAYYDTAMRRILELDPEMTFFVFSDDPERAGAWIRIQAERQESLGRGRFVLASAGDEDCGYLDLYLMSLCRSHIIANSSFSWWGAWLSGALDAAEPARGAAAGAAEVPERPSPDSIALAGRGVVFAPSIWNNEPDGSELRRLDIFAPGMRRINPNGLEVTQRPLVSVIVTAYNVAPYIGRAVRSVFAQTYENLEIIAVDDGSEDGTGALLDALAAQDRRMRVVHTPNRGVSAARNEGLRCAHGEFVGFVDGDDAADPLLYEAMVRGALESGADMTLVKYREVTPDGPELPPFRAQTPRDDVSAEETGAPERPRPDAAFPSGAADTAPRLDRILAESILWNREDAVRAYIRSGLQGADAEIVFHSAVWSKLFSRKVLRGNLFPEGTSAEDIPFTTRALCRARRVLYLKEPLYAYSLGRSEGIMSTRRACRTLEEEIPAWQTHLSLLRENGLAAPAEESEFYYYRRLLAYETEYRRCEATRAQAQELRGRILEQADRILELAGHREYGRRGDRARLRLYVQSPRVYDCLSGLYEKTAAWRKG